MNAYVLGKHDERIRAKMRAGISALLRARVHYISVPFDIARMAVSGAFPEVPHWIAGYACGLSRELSEQLRIDLDPFVRVCLRENLHFHRHSCVRRCQTHSPISTLLHTWSGLR